MTRHGMGMVEIIIICLTLLVVWAMLLPLYGMKHQPPKIEQCICNQKQISTAIQIFAQEHQERLPQEQNIWTSIEVPHKVLHCLDDGTSHSNSYVFNHYLSKMTLEAITNPVVMLQTADGQQTNNGQAAGPNLLFSAHDLVFRHGTADNRSLVASFCDGHVEVLSKTDLQNDKGVVLHPKGYSTHGTTNTSKGQPGTAVPQAGR